MNHTRTETWYRTNRRPDLESKHTEYGIQRFNHHPEISLSSEVKTLVTFEFITCIMSSWKRLTFFSLGRSLWYTSYWPSVKWIILAKFYICAFMNQDEVKVHKYGKKNSWPISSHLNQTSLVYYKEKDHYLLPSACATMSPRGTTDCVMLGSKLRTGSFILYHFI